MNSSEFSTIRHSLNKSQAQMARLLGISPRAVQSVEQGWRKVTASTERQMLFLLYMKAPPIKIKPCWQIKKCGSKTRRNCPAWEFRAGHICWFVNGTVCEGRVQQNWNKKMQLCRQCEVFTSQFPAPLAT